MQNNHKIHHVAAVISLLCLVIGVWTLYTISIAPNQGLYLYVATGLVAGKEMYVDFFEVNFPFIFYFFTIPVLLDAIVPIGVIVWAKHVNLMVVLGSYSFALYLLACSGYSRQHYLKGSLSVAISFGVFVLPFLYPVSSFGEKEHLFVVLTLPYMVVAFFIGDHYRQSHRAILVWVGVLAAMGFCIKPHFALLLIAIEGYLMITRKNPRHWLRTETVVIGLLGVVCMAFLWLVTPAFFTHSLPFSTVAYERHSWLLAIVAMSQYIYFFLLLFVVFAKDAIKEHPEQQCWLVAFVAALGVVVIGGRSLDYYYYPATFFALILVSGAAGQFIARVCANLKQIKHIINAHYLDFSAALFLIPYVLVVAYIGLANSLQEKVAQSSYALEQMKYYVNKHHSGDEIFAFGNLPLAFPLVNYTNATWSWENSSMWFAAGVHAAQWANGASPKLEALKAKHMDSVVDYFNRFKPQLVVVSTVEPFVDQANNHYGYLRYHLEDPRFKAIWRHYHLADEVVPNKQYRLQLFRYGSPE